MREYIRNHFKYTGSQRALNILQNWEEEKDKFIKIMPKEYKAVLELKKESEKEKDLIPQ